MTEKWQFAVGRPANPTEVFRIGYGSDHPCARLGTVAFRVYDWGREGDCTQKLCGCSPNRGERAHELALRIVAALEKDGLR